MNKRFLIVAAIGLILTGSIFAQKKPEPKIFGFNLIKNGDAEDGNGNGWTNADELKTIVYGEFGGGPTPNSEGPSNRGEKYFYIHTTTEQPTATFVQEINLSKITETIDKGKVEYNFGGWFGVANGSSSAGRLKILFLDKEGKEILMDQTAEITEANRPPDEVLAEKKRSGNLPVGTRTILVTMEFKLFGKHEENQDNLAFADNLSLVLTEKEK